MIVYSDTSTIGGCFDLEFREHSLLLFEEFITGSKFIMLSDLVYQELELARQEIREKVL